MTVKELKELLNKYPDNMEVVYENFEDEGFNYITDGYVRKDHWYDGSEHGNDMLFLFES